MKLKKIVSLALAGIMAVSMLAGCKNDGSSSSSSSEVVTTPVTGLASGMNAGRNDYAKTSLKLTYTESSDLATILQTLAEDKYGKDSNAIETAAGTNGYGAAAVLGSSDTIYTKLSEKLSGGAVFATTNVMKTLTAGTHKYVRIYTAGGNNSLQTVGNEVSSNANSAVINKTEMPLTGTGLKADYTAEVAAVKVASPDHAETSIWVVAVVYTQTVTATV